MKILHTADLHLGAINRKLNASQRKVVLSEQLKICSDLFSYAKDNGIDALLICGDLFHTSEISAKIERVFFNAVQDFSKPVIYISGNHDEEKAIFSYPENFIILKGSVRLDGVVISDGSNLQTLQKEDKNIVVMHGDIFSRGNDYIDIKSLKGDFVDYLALGHLHSYCERDFGRGNAVYCGTLQGNGFDECGDKGFVVLDTITMLHHFVPFAFRRYKIVDVDISGQNKFNEIVQNVEYALNDISTNDLVRVVLKGSYEENSEKYLHLIEEKFKARYFYFELRDESQIKIDFEKLKAEKLSFKAELLSLIMQDDTLSDSEKTQISQISIEALRGDDLSL